MSASNAFRTSLMQQFAVAAKSQSKPPLALIGWLTSQNNGSIIVPPEHAGLTTTTPSTTQHPPVRGRSLSSISSKSLQSSISKGLGRTCSNQQLLSPRRSVPDLSNSSRGMSSSPPAATDDDDDEEEELESPSVFQKLLQTRRTRNHFAPISLEEYSTSYWRDVLDRAALCGFSAPNHHRSEPFTFKRMVAQSAKTKRLADIAYHVNLLKHVQQQQKDVLTGGGEDALASREAIEEGAQRKRERWNQIPAFLVALVTTKHYEEVTDNPSCSSHPESSLKNPYELLPYVPPQSEKELEDYASACAAVQNVLLSLHSEQIASKWVTGPVVRTRAFRELVEASPSDRVVGLIMVGKPDESKRMFPRRRHRELHGDVLVDL